MKKVVLLLAMLMTLSSAWAIPAKKGAVKCVQPDGTSVMLELHGDEFYHFSTTIDGYTVLQNEQGVYEYARREGNRLVSTGVQAHDLAQRSAAEISMLQSLEKRITDQEAVGNTKPMRAKRDASSLMKARFDQSQFRGLVILVNFTDVKFSRNDANELYTNMVSQKNYTGYTNEDGSSNPYGKFDGSVRDYFYAQSMGQFDPEFDVYGPIDVAFKSTQCGNNTRAVFQTALKNANSQIDYSQYDGNGDGKVDMVFFLVAGWGAHVQGNNSALLWPHKSTGLMTSKLDGMSFDLYACSTEMLGSEGFNLLDGIGTICHEFSHVLGLPDFYDTDYNGSGGQSHHPGGWDVMAGGSDYNYGRTPCAYTIFERYALGWATPPTIKEPGSFSLGAVHTSNEGYIIKTPNRYEYFILENRQKTDWDRYLPGHGMIVARVDSASAYVWASNDINNNPARNYYELLRAGATTSGDLASDPYPGTLGITHINNATSPSLRTWSKAENSLKIENIREDKTTGVITFDIMNSEDELTSVVETFEGMDVMSENVTKGVEGVFTTWDFAKSYVKTPGTDLCIGTKSVQMTYPSQFTSVDPVYFNVSEVRFNVYNPTGSGAKFGLSYSVNDGSSWVKAKNVVGTDAIIVPAHSNLVCSWLVPVNNTQPVRYRVVLNSGASSPSYVDNFTIIYTGEPGGGDEPSLPGDVTGDGTVDIADVNAAINVMLGKEPNSKYDGRADQTGDGNVDIADVNKVINAMLGK